MITVQLDIFSARPNPVWTLTANEEKELIARVLANPSLTDAPKSTDKLGYRGFIVTASDEAKATLEKAGLPSFFYVESRKRAAAEAALIASIEAGKVPEKGKKFALESMKADRKLREDFWKKHKSKDSLKADPTKEKGFEPSLDPSLKPNIPLDAPRPEPLPPASSSSSGSGPFVNEFESGADLVLACGPNIYTSDTNFSYWNDSYSILNNNCYNFAANYRSNTFAQPGTKSNVAHTSLACNNAVGTTSYCAAYDGFTNACWTGNELYTCLVIDPGYDYHWYRLCANGHWCHKPGETAARNYDDSGYWITDPATCDRGWYSLFCGYRYFPYGWTVS